MVQLRKIRLGAPVVGEFSVPCHYAITPCGKTYAALEMGRTVKFPGLPEFSFFIIRSWNRFAAENQESLTEASTGRRVAWGKTQREVLKNGAVRLGHFLHTKGLLAFRKQVESFPKLKELSDSAPTEAVGKFSDDVTPPRKPVLNALRIAKPPKMRLLVRKALQVA